MADLGCHSKPTVGLSRPGVAGETHRAVKGPTKRDERISIRLPGDVLERLRIVATSDGRSVADWSYRVIEQAIARAEAKLARGKPRSRQ